MATRAQVLELLKQGHSYETAARELGIPAGQAFMVATGLSADSSETPSPEEISSLPELPASPQQLVNSAQFNPTRKPHVEEWVRRRAARELKGDA
ncbi:MAG TPA: helix-turn-helix domain-containing protein [Solirubrobacteraceae bacterium]|nr:helix-turn-helix domain-containing protein [Solirubrobacteraceae bacterium]